MNNPSSNKHKHNKYLCICIGMNIYQRGVTFGTCIATKALTTKKLSKQKESYKQFKSMYSKSNT
jgi:hypothetical protein